MCSSDLQTDLATIAATTLNTMRLFHVAGAVQLRSDERSHSNNSVGSCSAMEEAVLSEMAQRERIVDLGNRSAFNYKRATIIVYDMPLDDRELYGRLKDVVVKMAEALDVHLNALETVMAARARGDHLLAQVNQKAALAQELRAALAVQGVAMAPDITAKLEALCSPAIDVSPVNEPEPQQSLNAGVELF